jgi:hypothetical protein
VAILASIFAAIGNQAGKLLTTALGWASTLLFGRVPREKQVLLSAITLGSLAWVVVLIGVLLPAVGTFLLTAMPLPAFIDQNWVRLAMLVAALIVPIIVGLLGLFMFEPERRPRGAAAIKQVLRGYPVAFLLAFTIVWLAVIGVARKIRTLARRWSDGHIPIVVREGGYETLVDDLDDALQQAGLPVTRRPASRTLSVPARLVAVVAGAGVRSLVPDRLTVLRLPNLEVDLYPSDIAISGEKAELARARAAIASRLTSTAAHLTSSKEAQAVEDRIERIAHMQPEIDADGKPMLPQVVARELNSIDGVLASLDVDYDEWEVLYRMRLQVERDLLTGSRVGQAFPGGASRAAAAIPEAGRRAGMAEWAIGLGALALTAIDIGLAALERVRDRRRTPKRSKLPWRR